jgi:hypothetical protein
MQSDSAYPLPARHPWRRRFPPPVIAAVNEDSDLKLFALSFTAFFIVIYGFIA